VRRWPIAFAGLRLLAGPRVGLFVSMRACVLAGLANGEGRRATGGETAGRIFAEGGEGSVAGGAVSAGAAVAALTVIVGEILAIAAAAAVRRGDRRW
jgi:hypothetical protein